MLGQPQIATVKRDATIANAEREKKHVLKSTC